MLQIDIYSCFNERRHIQKSKGGTGASSAKARLVKTHKKNDDIKVTDANDNDTGDQVISSSLGKLSTTIIDNSLDNSNALTSVNERTDRNSMIGLAIFCIVIAAGNSNWDSISK